MLFPFKENIKCTYIFKWHYFWFNVLVYFRIWFRWGIRNPNRMKKWFYMFELPSYTKRNHWRIWGGRGGEERPPPPGLPNSFDFMQFPGKFGKIVCWRPLGELAPNPPPPPHPRGNPGSAPRNNSKRQTIKLIVQRSLGNCLKCLITHMSFEK